jgi:tetratricopeptide (TPR) repeat protein
MDYVKKIETLAAAGKYDKIISILKGFLRPETYKDHPVIYSKLAWAYMHNREYHKALDHCNKALALNDASIVRYQRGIIKLFLGDITGFSDYHYRWEHEDVKSHRSYLEKLGSYIDNWEQLLSLPEKRLLISGEQGYGDELMFSRVLPFLSEYDITLVSTPEMKDFLQIQYPNIKIEPMGYKPEKDTWGVSTLGDLFTAKIVYDGKVIEHPIYNVPSPITLQTDALKIGICYKTGRTSDTANNRSLNPEIFRQLTKIGNLYSFQVPFERLDFVRPISEVKTFLDTATWLMTMDLVVTCDTSLAHLALVLGKKTVLVYEKYLDWRWKIGLYPEVHLITPYGNFVNKVLQIIDK